MNRATGPQAADIHSEYHADFAVGEHSARHLRRILRLYLVGSGPAEVTDAAEPALTELVANVVRHVPGRRCRVCLLLRPAECGWRSRTTARSRPRGASAQGSARAGAGW